MSDLKREYTAMASRALSSRKPDTAEGDSSVRGRLLIMVVGLSPFLVAALVTQWTRSVILGIEVAGAYFVLVLGIAFAVARREVRRITSKWPPRAIARARSPSQIAPSRGNETDPDPRV